MMKHGMFLPALVCWLTATGFAAEVPPGAIQALSAQEMETIEGGDLILSVDRDKQMMTVTRYNPGSYDKIECYTLKVTTSVVRNKDVTPTNSKGAMSNLERSVLVGGVWVNPTQFPSGVSGLLPQTTSLNGFAGPAIRTDATQVLTGRDAENALKEIVDTGYLIHYVDPSQSTNTLGCIGVQSLDGMNRLAETLRVDNASYAKPSQAKQTVSVSSYTNGTPAPASKFQATEVKKPVSATKPMKAL